VATATPGLQGKAPFWVEFDATTSSCSDPNDWITSLVWTTSDGASSSAGWLDHTFSAAGTYTATIKATDAFGNQAQKTLTITVTP
jgi:PKD repeat protein